MEKLKILKKYLILSIILFSVFLINTKDVKAYGEEVSPMLDFNNYTINFENKTWNDEQEHLAMNWISNNCKNYKYYMLASGNAGIIGSGYSNVAVYIYCFNGNYENISLGITTNSDNSLELTLAPQPFVYRRISYLRAAISYDNSFLNISTSDSGRFYFSIENFNSLRTSNSTTIPYIKSNLNGIFFTNTGIGLSSMNYDINSVKYNDVIYNNKDKLFDLENSNFFVPTSFEYEIGEGTEKGKKLSLFFNNYKETDYSIINNYQTGEEIKILDLKNNSTKIFDNISQDNTFQIKIYDIDNNIILDRTVDVQEQLRLTNERYIYIGNLNTRGLNSYKLGFFNTKNDDKCFYKFKNENEKEIDCLKSTIIIESPNKNTYVENYIKNKKGEIVVRKNVNLNYLKNLPQFKFESYYDDNEDKQILKIIVENLKESDVISYSYDNEYWYILETKRINYLDFYNSTDVYFKVERNSEIISEAYFDVVYNSYVNSSINNNLENTNFSLKNLLDSFKNYSENNKTLNIGADVYNQLKISKLGLYIIIIITGSFIILFVKSIKR